MTPDTGNLATIVFTESGFTARFKSIGELDRAIGKLEASGLQTDVDKEYIADDLGEPGELDLEFYFDTTATPPPRGVPDICVVTFPTRSNEGTPASYTGSGFFLNQLFPSLQNGQLQMGKAKFAFDNRETPFAFTPAIVGA
jgi:hypothetical protein